MSEPDIADSAEKPSGLRDNPRYEGQKKAKTGPNAALQQNPGSDQLQSESHSIRRRRQLRELAKFHARDIIAFKVNKKLAEQAAIAATNAAQQAILTEKRKLDFADLVDSDFDLSWVLGCERFRFKHKTEPTIQPTAVHLVAQYHKQEDIRYNNPLEPFEYQLGNKTYTVAPIIRNRKQLKAIPSTYPLLVNNRPPQASLLAIVRDAAARLPDNVGTRSDVALLMLDSAYIAPGVT